jgi:DNA polymerase-3 subunit delta'
MAFTDFPRQERMIRLLQRSLGRNRLAHAYLFTGNDLEELEGIAGTLAKAINCQTAAPAAGQTHDSCERCDSCRRINANNHPDVHWLRPESKLRVITIEQARELMRAVQLTPTGARHKVGIVVAAERMSPQAANAFLKTLEEPPSRSLLILLSTDPQRLLETIRSRCLSVRFAADGTPAPASATADWIGQWARGMTEESGSLLGRYKVVGDLLGRLAGIKTGIEEKLGARSPLEQYPEADAELKEKWEAELSAATEAEYRHQRERLLGAFQLWLRDVWLRALTGQTTGATYPDLAAETERVAARIRPEGATENLRILEDVQQMLRSNVQEALCLEVALLRLKM